VHPLARGIKSSTPFKGQLIIYFSANTTKSYPITASESPFTEPTSPNPTITRHADTTEALHNYGSYLTQCLPKFVQQFSVLKDELTLYIAPSAVVPVLTFLRDHSQCQFKSVVDISGVDYPEREKRFEVVYHLLSVSPSHAGRIRVKTYAGEADPVPSATSVFRGADWYVSNRCEIWIASDILLAGMRERYGIYLGFSSKIIQTCAYIYSTLTLLVTDMYVAAVGYLRITASISYLCYLLLLIVALQALKVTLSEKTSL
jgi:hypothetical protein